MANKSVTKQTDHITNIKYREIKLSTKLDIFSAFAGSILSINTENVCLVYLEIVLLQFI